MAMAMAMAKLQRSKSNWEGLLRRFCLSAHSERPAHSDGTHHPPPPVPKGIWEFSKNWILLQGNVGKAQQTKYFPPREMLMTKQQGESNSNWEGMLKWWSLAKQSYGPPRMCYDDPVYCAARVYEIAMYFKIPADEFGLTTESLSSVPFFDAWFYYLQERFEHLEMAHELHSIDCLVPFLHNVLYYPHAGIRANAATLVTTMVRDNPMSQQLVVELNGLQPLLYNFTSDPDETSRTRALGAISALIRDNKPGIIAFKLQLDDCYAKLRDALSETKCADFQWVALNIIRYLIHETRSDCNTVIELGLPRIMMHLASSDYEGVREAALRCLLVLTRDEGEYSSQLVKNDDKLKQVLQEYIERISAMPLECLAYTEKEVRVLVDSLWNACYNEPSPLGEKGLLVLPGEDAPEPDDGSKLFEPPLGGWDAVQAANRKPVGEKKDCNIVTELGLPRIMMHLASSDDAEVREAALRGLLVLLRDEGGNSGQLVKNNDKLKQVLQERLEGSSGMAPEDPGATREERQLVDSLWNACYNESSSLQVNSCWCN